MRLRNLKLALMIAMATVALTSNKASACSDYSCGYDGLYNTGGYGLYGFGASLYDASSYLGGSFGYGNDWYGSSYSGGCGSFTSSCGGGYDYSGLYGNSWGMGSYGADITIDIDINILGGGYGGGSCGGGCGGSYGGMYGSYGGLYGYDGSLNQFPGYMMGGQYGGGYGYPGIDVGCSLGYCSGGGYMPYPGSSWYGGSTDNWFNPGWSSYNQFPFNVNISYPGYTSYPTMPSYPNYNILPYPMPTFPQTPPPQIPWGTCDGVIVQCPSGPIARPTPPVFPTFPVTPNPTGPITTPVNYPPVTYQPREQTTPTDPIRYKVPRGGVQTTH